MTKAEIAAEKRFDNVNEFRGQLKDQSATFITRSEVDIRFKAIESKLVDIEAQVTRIISRAEGSAQLWQGITAALAIGISMFMAFMAFRKRPAD